MVKQTYGVVKFGIIEATFISHLKQLITWQ